MSQPPTEIRRRKVVLINGIRRVDNDPTGPVRHLSHEFLHRIELICLAGFLRLLTANFVRTWEHRLINIHPALLPAYRGLHTHERALAEGDGEVLDRQQGARHAAGLARQGAGGKHDTSSPESSRPG